MLASLPLSARAAEEAPVRHDASSEAGDSVEIGIRERLGSTVPAGTTFTDSEGCEVTLGSLITGPTILALGYYRCTNVCPDLLVGLADVVNKSATVPGRDYRLITVSFDEEDTPETARRKKADYLRAASTPERSIDPGAWRFLTGSRDSIGELTRAVGFGFKRAEGGAPGFQHPTALVVLDRKGRITRYLYGSRFMPFDVDMAMSEASEGRIGPSIPRLARLCFTYDPEKQTYAFSFLKVGGAAILAVAGLFAAIVIRGSVRRGGRKGG